MTRPASPCIGAGFGALSTVREITVIAPRAELHYLPGIIWIPSACARANS
jgi:sulfide:quinone oxidoreductase